MITVKEANIAEAEAIILNEDIYDRIADDTCKPREEVNNFRDLGILFDNYEWYAGYVNGNLASLLWIFEDMDVDFMVLPSYRRHARKLFDSSIEKLRPTERSNMWCSIPTCYRAVINFAKKRGFTESGIEEKAYKKRGVFYNNIILIYTGKLCQE